MRQYCTDRPLEEALLTTEMLHQDESRMDANSERWWLPTAYAPLLTLYAAHLKGGQEALEAIGTLPTFTGTSAHDGWGACFRYTCAHALCVIHLPHGS